MIIIGSVGLIARVGDIGRSPGDTDIIGSYDEFVAFVKARPQAHVKYNADAAKAIITGASDRPIEFEIAWEDSTGAELISLVAEGHDGRTIHSGLIVPSLNALLAVKLAHRFAPQKAFKKTMSDIKLMRSLGGVVEPRFNDWVKRRASEVTAKHPNLNVSKSSFFNPKNVPYKYDHDSIHLAVAHGDKPAYMSFQEPGCEVKCSEELFNAQPFEVRINSVVEESYVLAIERSHVPFGTLSERDAFDMALEKVCTTISSGWWRTFAYDNFDEVNAAYRPGYLDRFNEALDRGRILPFHAQY